MKSRPIEDYEIRDAANTIARAEEHKRNKPLMLKVRRHVAGLHKAVNEKPTSKNEMPRR